MNDNITISEERYKELIEKEKVVDKLTKDLQISEDFVNKITLDEVYDDMEIESDKKPIPTSNEVYDAEIFYSGIY